MISEVNGGFSFRYLALSLIYGEEEGGVLR